MIFSCPHCGTRAEKGQTDCARCKRAMTRPCSACAEPIAATATACKYCGEEISPAREPARAEDVRFLENTVVSPACAWEDTSKGLLRRWWGTWAQSNFGPKAFFRGLKPAGGQAWPVGYAFGLTAQILVLLVLAMIAGVGVRELYGINLMPWVEKAAHGPVPVSGEELHTAARWSPAAVAAVGIPAAFIGMTLALYVSSLLWHVFLKLLGARGGFQSTLRVVGYGSGATAWLLIPFAGMVMAPLMKLSLYYHGFRELHGLSRGRALFAVLAPVLIAAGVAAWALFSSGCCPMAPADVRWDGTSF